MESQEVSSQALQKNLRANLARVRRRLPELAQALEDASVAEGEPEPEVLVGPRGALTVRCGEVLLGSSYDPKAEGERVGYELAKDPGDILVALGFGLGYHVEAYQKLRPGPVFIYEPSPARLAAVLSARPACSFLGRVDVYVTCDLLVLLRMIESYYVPGLRVKVHPHPSLLELDPKAVREALGRVRRAKESKDITAATRVNMLAEWTSMTVENLAEIIATPSLRRLSGKFGDRPAVVCAAGPSLNKQLPILAEYRDRVLVIAIGQTLGSLRAAGIEPDFVHILESQPVNHQLERAGGAEGVNLVVTPDVDPSLFQVPASTFYMATPASNRVGAWIESCMGESYFFTGGGTVAQSAIGLAIGLGLRSILLIGQDLAFSNGEVYAQGSAYDAVGVRIDDDGTYVRTNTKAKYDMFSNLASVEQRDDAALETIWIEGWYGEKVPTMPTYANFVEQYRDLGKWLASQGVALVNCSEGGAYIHGLTHQSFREALEEYQGAPLDAAQLIAQDYGDFTPPGPAALEEPRQKLRRLLSLVEKEARKGRKCARRAGRELTRARSPSRTIEVLRPIGQSEKKVRKLLSSVSWIDAVVQPEIHRLLAATSCSDRSQPTPEDAVREAEFLFEATLVGIEKSCALLSRMDALTANPLPLKRSRRPSDNLEDVFGSVLG